MEGKILNLDKIKIYYPFLRDNKEIESGLKNETQWIIGYLLISDVVVIPPRELIAGKYGLSNLNSATHDRLIVHMISKGKVITTSSNDSVRDSLDLIDYYNSVPTFNADLKIRVYSRDALMQKNSYTSFLLNHIEHAHYYRNDIKSELVTFLHALPDHPSILNKINKIRSGLHPDVYARLKKEAFHSYFAGGAIGNGAIMPSMYPSDGKLSIYNPFYSKQAISLFMTKTQKLLGRAITEIPISLLEKIIHNLAIFRIRYFEIANQYKMLYERVSKLFEKTAVSINLPIDALYVFVALLITIVVSDVISPEVLFGSAFAAIAGKILWGYINRVLKITEFFLKKLQSYLKFTGLYDENRKEVISMIEEFESGVEKAIAR